MKHLKTGALFILVTLSLFLSILLGITVFLTYILGADDEEGECYQLTPQDKEHFKS